MLLVRYKEHAGQRVAEQFAVMCDSGGCGRGTPVFNSVLRARAAAARNGFRSSFRRRRGNVIGVDYCSEHGR